MATIKHYSISICWSEEDKCYAGKVDNINGLLLFEGKTLEDAFKDCLAIIREYEEIERENKWQQ